MSMQLLIVMRYLLVYCQQSSLARRIMQIRWRWRRSRRDHTARRRHEFPAATPSPVVTDTHFIGLLVLEKTQHVAG